MPEVIKVFKNVHTQNALGAASTVVLATTAANQTAVIKDVACAGVYAVDLDLDGRTVVANTIDTKDLSASGDLIMGPSSTLSLKFPFIGPPVTETRFIGMFFSNSTDTQNLLRGDALIKDGKDHVLTSCTSLSTSNNRIAYAAAACMVGTTETFFRKTSGTVYAYTIAGGTTTTWQATFGASGYSLCTDGTYLYSTSSGSGQQTVARRLVDGTGSNSTITFNSTFSGPAGNQGSGMAYHNNKLYTKEYGPDGTIYVLDMSTLNVSLITGASVGSYSDGFGIVTNAAGKTFLIEQGTTHWWYWDVDSSDTAIGTATATSGSINNGTSGSTEYGNGFMEVAPGICFIYTEYSDNLTIIDMNKDPVNDLSNVRAHVGNSTSRNGSVHNSYGDSFSACGFIEKLNPAVNYDAYCSGVLVTDAS
jgi:hypothetical protein